jgi:hypothetical protein
VDFSSVRRAPDRRSWTSYEASGVPPAVDALQRRLKCSREDPRIGLIVSLMPMTGGAGPQGRL